MHNLYRTIGAKHRGKSRQAQRYAATPLVKRVQMVAFQARMLKLELHARDQFKPLVSRRTGPLATNKTIPAPATINPTVPNS